MAGIELDCKSAFAKILHSDKDQRSRADMGSCGAGDRVEVLIGVATVHEFACYSSHKANDDFSYSSKALELR